MTAAQQQAMHWQHTRCRIGNVTFHDERGPNIIRFNKTHDDLWGLAVRLFDGLLAGDVVSVALATIQTDQTIATGYSIGTGGLFTLAGAVGELQRRILIDGQV